MKKISLLTLLVLFMGITSCVKENFDTPQPEPETDPDIETNASIEDLVAYWQSGEYIEIEEDLILDAVVIADDLSGNYFRSIVLQDETGGIELLLNARELHVDYPIGRRVFLHCQGLIISDYAGKIQLGGSTYLDDGDLRLGGIEETLFDKYITKGIRNQMVTPAIKTINELSQDDLSTLIQLENVQFTAEDSSSTYAGAEERISFNLNLESCDGSSIILRSSGFADFAGMNVPNGNGSIIGVYSVFNGDKQLFIRTTDDVDFSGVRCGSGSSDCDDIDGTLVSLQDLRSDFTSGNSTISANQFVEGTVISDADNGTITARNMVVQDTEGYGIVLRFSDFHNVAINSTVKVDVSNAQMSEFNGLLQIDGLSTTDLCVSGSNLITPNVVSIGEILQDFERYESTLVQIDNGLLSGGTSWADGPSLSDGTGSIQVFTRGQADFSSDAFPTDTIRMTAVVGQFNDPQLSIRSAADVTVIGGGTGSGDTEAIPFTTDFGNGIPNNWQVVNTAGTRVWEGRDFDDVFYAQMSAYTSNGTLDVETWMITAPFDFDAQSGEVMELEIADAFQNGNPLKVMYSTDYSGLGDPSSATWNEIGSDQINPLINNSGSYDNVYESTGSIDLSAISGTAYIAFLYDSKGTVSTTIQLSKVNIR